MGLIARIQDWKTPKTKAGREAALVSQLRRNQRYTALLLSRSHSISHLLLFLGFLYLLFIPLDVLHQNTRVDENAIQPGQVTTYWNWAQVKEADKLDPKIRTWSSLPHAERAEEIAQVFKAAGLPTSTQSYSYAYNSTEAAEGTNVYAILRAPKTDGAEAIVLAASWSTRAEDEQVNVRGIASVLIMAQHLQKLAVWSKDIIFLVSDGYTSGAHAWINAYHEEPQSNLISDPVELRTGSIWAVLQVDYPYHSFSHIGIYFEALNGLLPNIDLINSVAHISRWTGGAPVRLHNIPDELRPDTHSSFPLADHRKVKEYELAGKNVWEMVKRQSLGIPSGPEGVYARFRIDAIAIYAVPAEGPHGFFSIGKTIESSLRAINNLIERFHASVFLYLLASPRRLIALPKYLAAPLLMGISLNVKGLAIWASLFPKDGIKQKRPIGWAIGAVVFTQIVACLLYGVSAQSLSTATSGFALASGLLLSSFFGHACLPKATFSTLKAFNLILAGMIICIIAVLNFSLATLIGILVSTPLLFTRSRSGPIVTFSTIAQTAVLVATSPPGLHLLLQSFRPELLAVLMRDWQMLGGYTIPLLYLVVLPLQLQGLVLAWMPS